MISIANKPPKKKKKEREVKCFIIDIIRGILNSGTLNF